MHGAAARARGRRFEASPLVGTRPSRQRAPKSWGSGRRAPAWPEVTPKRAPCMRLSPRHSALLRSPTKYIKFASSRLVRLASTCIGLYQGHCSPRCCCPFQLLFRFAPHSSASLPPSVGRCRRHLRCCLAPSRRPAAADTVAYRGHHLPPWPPPIAPRRRPHSFHSLPLGFLARPRLWTCTCRSNASPQPLAVKSEAQERLAAGLSPGPTVWGVIKTKHSLATHPFAPDQRYEFPSDLPFDLGPVRGDLTVD